MKTSEPDSDLALTPLVRFAWTAPSIELLENEETASGAVFNVNEDPFMHYYGPTGS